MTTTTLDTTAATAILPKDWTALVARVLLAVLFLLAGLGKLAAIEATTGYIASVGLPMAAAVCYATIALEIVGGVLLIAGYRTRLVAIGLGLFTILAGIIFHADFADQAQMTSFLKNLAIAGGMFQVAAFGPGRFSLDRG
ncbi:DoxX family protein [Porphyrobacter sp. LM 6]|uniref:DoxX family protein n=1 Tax=Porphyrobacter sp. LM 6 TaxID=1896196 RepID=UPI0008465AA3|nr:DoxX family protein [Porphyrobacter sp. LM 6]AOL95249.1 putative oxidoreductase [Porphyrobacter sp. LM 6]